MDTGKVEQALVIGAGVMGHCIAQVFAQGGIETHLVDVDRQRLERAMNQMKSNLKVLSDSKILPQHEITAILGRIHPSVDLSGSAKGVAFALEAVTERPDVKKEIFSQLDDFCPADAVLASNTSSLDIFSIAEIKRPERLVVAHWFEPAHIIPLVEVVPGPKTSPDVVSFTAQLMERLGKRPLVMKKFVPAFIVNRIQQAISGAVWEMLENGWASPEEIDLAVKLSLGIRLPVVGVVQRIDFTGLDLVYDIMKSKGDVPPLIEGKVKEGALGVKTSRGIYDYGGRSQEEILKKRDERYLKMLEHLERIKAFEPI